MVCYALKMTLASRESRATGEHLFDHLVATPAPGNSARARSAPDSSFCVLGSSSSGNCSVLIHQFGAARRITLIDAGLSPRRTRRHLASLGVGLDQIDDVLITHLDSDHFQTGWTRALSRRVRIRVHSRHVARARSLGLGVERLLPFEEPFRVARCVTVHPTLLAHDDLGVAAFRFVFDGGRAATLGFATDVGRVTTDLTTHLAGVDVLAIESNYCPVMQVRSSRPAFLKKRIMGGAGHLSNDQCRMAVEAIGPTRHVVLLHLSRECNTPQRAAELHEQAPYSLSIARHDQPIRPIPVSGAGRDAACTVGAQGR